jgi:uncharacterized protein
MRPVRTVGLYFMFVAVGGALVAPWLHTMMAAGSQALPVLETLASKPFPRYVSRALLFFALLGLWPLLRAVDLRSWRELGLARRPDGLTQIGRGFLLGLVSLALIVFVVLVSGVRVPEPGQGMGTVLIQVFKAGLAAIIVAPLEEVLFRGILFGALRKTFHWTAALVFSSAIYAALHFMEKVGDVGQVDWSTGFVVLFRMFSGFGDLEKVLPGFLNLMLVGMTLGLVYQRSGTLHYSIGLHAGWIVWMKTFGFITREAESEYSWLLGGGRPVDSWLAFVVLMCILLFMDRLAPQEDSHTGWKERRLFS